MIRGIQLKTATKRPLAASTSPRRTPTTDEIKTKPSLKQQVERKLSNPQENAKDKEIEKLNLKILSLEKLIEQLSAEIKDKGNTITELEEKLKAQVKKYNINK